MADTPLDWADLQLPRWPGGDGRVAGLLLGPARPEPDQARTAMAGSSRGKDRTVDGDGEDGNGREGDEGKDEDGWHKGLR